jgi:hypothetical protein
VGAVGALSDVPTTTDPFETDVPPSELNDTVKVFAVQCAYKVISELVEYVLLPAVYDVPVPSEELFHPTNV